MRIVGAQQTEEPERKHPEMRAKYSSKKQRLRGKEIDISASGEHANWIAAVSFLFCYLDNVYCIVAGHLTDCSYYSKSSEALCLIVSASHSLLFLPHSMHEGFYLYLNVR